MDKFESYYLGLAGKEGTEEVFLLLLLDLNADIFSSDCLDSHCSTQSSVFSYRRFFLSIAFPLGPATVPIKTPKSVRSSVKEDTHHPSM